VFLLAGGAVSWRSKKQTIVALSTCEAEYVPLCSATKEALWLTRLLQNLLPSEFQVPTILCVDNQGTIDLSKTEAINNRTKHIDVRYHFIRECIQNKLVTLQKVSSEDQLADSLTRPLVPNLFLSSIFKLGLTNGHSNTHDQGGVLGYSN
jgi:hypothetical protein